MPGMETAPDQGLVPIGEDDPVFPDEFIDYLKTKDANEEAKPDSLISDK